MVFRQPRSFPDDMVGDACDAVKEISLGECRPTTPTCRDDVDVLAVLLLGADGPSKRTVRARCLVYWECADG